MNYLTATCPSPSAYPWKRVVGLHEERSHRCIHTDYNRPRTERSYLVLDASQVAAVDNGCMVAYFQRLTPARCMVAHSERVTVESRCIADDDS